MPKILSRNIVNLEQFPNITADIAEDITIGDLHANALKLLHLLIQEGVLYTSPEQYHLFYLLYQTSAELITPEELETILSIIDSLEVRHPNIFIRLIGDEHFDRGSNDLYIDMILKKLHDENIHYEIILSNHGARAIEQMESFHHGNKLYELDLEQELSNYQNQTIVITQDLINIIESILKTTQQYPFLSPIIELFQLHCKRIESFVDSLHLTPLQIAEAYVDCEAKDQQFNEFYLAQEFDIRIYLFYFDLQKHLDIHKNLAKVKYLSLNTQLMIAQRASFKNLNILYNRDLIGRVVIEDLYHRYYTPYLKLLSYTLDLNTKTITIFSHAPCGIECIEAIADFFGVPFQHDTLVSFAHMLDCINSQFVEQYVKNGRISELLSSNSIIHEFVWNRNYDVLCRPHKIFEYHVNYVHGHDKDEVNREEHVFSLDSRLGSIGMCQEKIVPIMNGEDLVLKVQGEYTLPYLVNVSEQAFLSSLADIIKLSIDVGQDSWRFSFERLRQIFESFRARHSSFNKYIQFYCYFVQKINPPVPWPLMEPQITCIEEMISLSPSVVFFSNDSSFFSSSIKSQIDALKTFLQAESPNTLRIK